MRGEEKVEAAKRGRGEASECASAAAQCVAQTPARANTSQEAAGASASALRLCSAKHVGPLATLKEAKHAHVTISVVSACKYK